MPSASACLPSAQAWRSATSDLDVSGKSLRPSSRASGAAASNLLGLSTQIPSQYIYQSDGPDRSYEVGSTKLQFKQTALKEIGFRLDESPLIVQALKTLGEKHITSDVIDHVRSWLPSDKRIRVLKDTERVTGWIYAAIQQICREEADG